MESENLKTSSFSCFSKCNTSRKAVFLPIPGNLANSLTATSSNFDGKEAEVIFFFLFGAKGNKKSLQTNPDYTMKRSAILATFNPCSLTLRGCSLTFGGRSRTFCHNSGTFRPRSPAFKGCSPAFAPCYPTKMVSHLTLEHCIPAFVSCNTTFNTQLPRFISRPIAST